MASLEQMMRRSTIRKEPVKSLDMRDPVKSALFLYEDLTQGACLQETQRSRFDIESPVHALAAVLN